LPTVLFTAMVSVATTVGASRIVRGTAITHPLGDPARPPDDERALRKRIVQAGMDALTVTPEAGQIFQPAAEPPPRAS
jgi:glycine reductase